MPELAHTMELLDAEYAITQQDWNFTTIVRIGGDKVQIKVRRNFYKFQSYAVASVLTAERKWEPLVSADRENWWDATDRISFRDTDRVKIALNEVALDLFNRAKTVLS